MIFSMGKTQKGINSIIKREISMEKIIRMISNSKIPKLTKNNQVKDQEKWPE